MPGFEVFGEEEKKENCETGNWIQDTDYPMLFISAQGMPGPQICQCI